MKYFINQWWYYLMWNDNGNVQWKPVINVNTEMIYSSVEGVMIIYWLYSMICVNDYSINNGNDNI